MQANIWGSDNGFCVAIFISSFWALVGRVKMFAMRALDNRNEMRFECSKLNIAVRSSLTHTKSSLLRQRYGQISVEIVKLISSRRFRQAIWQTGFIFWGIRFRRSLLCDVHGLLLRLIPKLFTFCLQNVWDWMNSSHWIETTMIPFAADSQPPKADVCTVAMNVTSSKSSSCQSNYGMRIIRKECVSCTSWRETNFGVVWKGLSHFVQFSRTFLFVTHLFLF